MDMGVVDLEEEGIEFTFETKGAKVEIAVYSLEKPDIPPVVTFDYDPIDGKVKNHRFPSHLTEKRRKMLRTVMIMDETDRKEALKYVALMQFIVYFKEVVKIEEHGTRTRHQAKMMRKDRTKPLPLVRKKYVIEDFDKEKLPRLDGKRKYTKPDSEVNVRGFYRHYKSGKVVWIDPQVRYKGKGKKQKQYEL